MYIKSQLGNSVSVLVFHGCDRVEKLLCPVLGGDPVEKL